jgi:hypothetical protein
MKTLPWKTVSFEDKSGSWLEAYIPHLQWTYIIEKDHFARSGYACSVYLNAHCSDSTPLHKRSVKSLRNAKDACLNHLLRTERHMRRYLSSTEISPTKKDSKKRVLEKIRYNRKLAA